MGRGLGATRLATQHGAGRAQLVIGDLTLTGAFSFTGKGNNIQKPWGSSPSYLSMIDQDFDRANEKAFLIGAAYDFSNVITKGLSANVNLVWGKDAINPSNGREAPDQGEYDLTVDYRPPGKYLAFFKGVWFRARGAINTAFISVASTPLAQALTPKPQIVSRAGWGADLASGGCPPRGPAEYGSVQAAVIHHTVNANDYTPEEAPSMSPGTSAIVGRRPSSIPRSITPRFGSSVVNG